MKIEEYIAEVIKGLQQAFDLNETVEEIDKKFYAFDPMAYGDWGLTIGGYGSDYICLCGCPVEFVVIGEPTVPCRLQISVFGGATEEADRALKIIDKLESIITEDVSFSEPDGENDLYIFFNYTVNKAEEISSSIIKTVQALTCSQTKPLTEELLCLCNK